MKSLKLMPQDYKISQAAIIDSQAWDASCSRAEIVFEPPPSEHICLFSLRLSCHHGFTLVEQLNEGHRQSRVSACSVTQYLKDYQTTSRL